jgi:hypothetical protein
MAPSITTTNMLSMSKFNDFVSYKSHLFDCASKLDRENNKNGLVQELQTDEELAADPSNRSAEDLPEQRKVFPHPGELTATNAAGIATHTNAEKKYERNVVNRSIFKSDL